VHPSPSSLLLYFQRFGLYSCNVLASASQALNGSLRVRYASSVGLKPHKARNSKAYRSNGAPRVGEGRPAPVACPREAVARPSVADVKDINIGI